MYELIFPKQFTKDFAKLDSGLQSRILVALEEIKTDPYRNATKLKEIEKGKFRRRVGDYRIRFDIYEKPKRVHLYRVRHRKDVYRS